MEFRFTPEEEAFRQEVREFLRRELPPDWDYDVFEGGEDDTWEFARAFTKKLGERRWTAPAWPPEYGGLGLDFMRQVILNEEISYHRGPNVSWIGVTYVGPTIIVHGTEEQKREFLPGIVSGEIVWCQGFSEPNAGSDLAGLQTAAVRDGDDYVVNGVKIWSSLAHRANWCFFLARTDPTAPKHKGISYFVVPMDTPGITVVPLINMAGLKGFNQVFFENVRVPARYRVGEENSGWYVAMTTLNFERSNIGAAAGARRSFDELVAYCREAPGQGGGRLTEEPRVRYRLAELAIEIEVGRYLSYRVASIQARGGVPNYEASIAKLYHSELQQRLARSGVEILGLYGQVREGDPHARIKGRFARRYLTSVASTIAAGTSEVQRNIIATRGLGLPRS